MPGEDVVVFAESAPFDGAGSARGAGGGLGAGTAGGGLGGGGLKVPHCSIFCESTYRLILRTYCDPIDGFRAIR